MKELSFVEELALAVVASKANNAEQGARAIKRYQSRCPRKGDAGDFIYLMKQKQVRFLRPDGIWDLYVQLVKNPDSTDMAQRLAL